MMSITKLVFGTAVALISSPRVFAVDEDWVLKFQSADTEAVFRSDVDSEIALTYLVSVNKQFHVKFLNPDCEGDITGGLTFEAKSSMLKGYVGNDDLVEVKYSFDKTTIANSSVWDKSSGTMSFCAEAWLKQGDEVIVTDRQNIKIAFDLTVDLNTNSAAENLSIESTEKSMDVESYILVCKCRDSFQCDAPETTLSPGDPLNICISSRDSGVVVLEELNSLKLVSEIQDVDDFQIVASNEPNKPVNENMSSLNQTNSNGPWVATTLVPAGFFSYSTAANVSVSGNVDVSLSRRLSDFRSLRAERPGHGAESVPFELWVALERERIVATSGGTTATLGLALTAAVSVFLFVIE